MLEMKILANREEWLKNRNRIGGSDASAILGMNPYISNTKLYRIKTGQMEVEDISEKSYVKYGTEAEKHLRELFKLNFPEYKVEYIENNMFLNDKYPFAHASLDGWITDQNGRKGVWECKTANILQSMQRKKWKDRVPDNYYIQILHYLMVTEFDFVELTAQLKNEYTDTFGVHVVHLETNNYHIERSEVEQDIQCLEQAEREFWQRVIDRREPNYILPKF